MHTHFYNMYIYRYIAVLTGFNASQVQGRFLQEPWEHIQTHKLIVPVGTAPCEMLNMSHIFNVLLDCAGMWMVSPVLFDTWREVFCWLKA